MFKGSKLSLATLEMNIKNGIIKLSKYADLKGHQPTHSSAHLKGEAQQYNPLKLPPTLKGLFNPFYTFAKNCLKEIIEINLIMLLRNVLAYMTFVHVKNTRYIIVQQQQIDFLWTVVKN